VIGRKMKKRTAEALFVLFLLVVLFQAGHFVEPLAHRKYKLEVLYLPSGRFLKQASLGYRDLAADLVWFKTIQYYGGYRIGENDLALFQHLVNVTTELDPHFTFAYLFGALIIAEDLGYFDEGMAVLKKGMYHNPGDWWLPFEMGFLNYVYSRNYKEAVRYFRLASRIPGSDEIAKRFAAFAAARGGYLEKSIAMWEDLARTSGNSYIRELARHYVDKLSKEMREKGATGK